MADRPILLYDGGCGFCKRWVAWCLDRRAEVDFEPCQDAHTIRDALGITDHDCTQSALFIDANGVKREQDAINAVLALIPGGKGLGWRALAKVGAIPGLHAMGGVGYRWVAKNRHKFRGLE